MGVNWNSIRSLCFSVSVGIYASHATLSASAPPLFRFGNNFHPKDIEEKHNGDNPEEGWGVVVARMRARRSMFMR